MHINGLAWTEAETSFATATWDAELMHCNEADAHYY